MRFIDAGSFTADRPWGALDIAEIDQATVRLHWTDSRTSGMSTTARKSSWF